MNNQFCECVDQNRVLSYCPRYQRDMAGRMRQICAGIDCDLGTAAAFREQWRQEAGEVYQHGRDGPKVKSQPIPLLLKTDQAPGDAVVMTAAIYSLHKAHPGKYLTAVESPYPEVFQHNPDVVFDGSPGKQEWDKCWLPLQMHYPAIHQSNQRGIHFMQGFCEHLSMALGVPVPLMTNRPHLYFDKYKDSNPSIMNLWVVCSGVKQDLTNKAWGQDRYQEVVTILKDKVQFVQVGNSKTDHPRLKYVTPYLVEQTTLRGLFNTVRAARGVLCGVSLLMHIAAALDKPCIVIAGGREPVQWNAYPKQHYLHTVGMLGCSSPQGDVGGACWRSRTVPLGDHAILDEHTCLRPIGTTPECMTLIEPAHVADLILKINKQYKV